MKQSITYRLLFTIYSTFLCIIEQEMRLKTGTFDLTNEGGNKENKIEQKIPLHSIYMQKCNKDRINK